MKTLFPKRKPKILKYTPSPYVRKMESVEFDVKSDYRKFAKFLRLSSDDLGRVKLPKKDELRKLNKETKPKPGKEDGGFGDFIRKLKRRLLIYAIGKIAIPALKIGAIAALGLGVTSLTGERMPIASFLPRGRRENRQPRGQQNPQPSRPRTTDPDIPRTTTVSPRRVPGQSRAGGTFQDNLQRQRMTAQRMMRPDGPTGPLDRLNRSRRLLGSQLETGTAFGGRGANAQRGVVRTFRQTKQVMPTLKKVLARLSNKAKKKLAFRFGKKFLMPIIKRIPFIGPLIDFAINVFLFKEPPGRAGFKAIGSAVGMWLGGGVGSILGLGLASWITTPVGAFLGSVGGDLLGGWLYDQLFGGKKAQENLTRKVGQKAVLNGKPVEWDGMGWVPEGTIEREGSAVIDSTSDSDEEEDDSIVPATHPDTGSGYTIKGLLDYQGRPVVLSKAGATAFARMVRDSMGVVKGSDVHSSQRSKEKNDSLPNAAPNSHHLYGNAIDIHGESQEWIKANGAKYGWKINNYPGSHGGHFNYKSSGSPPTETDSSKTSAAQPVTPVMGNLPSDYASSEQEAFAAAERYQASRKDFEVSRLTPAAEAATSDNVVVISQAPAPSQGQQGSQFMPIPIGGGRSGGSSVASIDPNQLVNSMHESLLLTKLANA